MANNWDFLKKKADKSIQRSRLLEACFEKESL